MTTTKIALLRSFLILNFFLLIATFSFFVNAQYSAEQESHPLVKRPFEAEDYYQIKSLSQLSISPDGRHVAFIQTQSSDDKQSRESNLWLYRAKSQSTHQLTFGNQDSNPLFSPTGDSILFQSKRYRNNDTTQDKASSLYLLPMHGGEAQELLYLQSASISNVAWHPSGKHVYLLLKHSEEMTDPLLQVPEKKHKADTIRVQHALYKRQGRYYLPQQQTLWRYDLDTRKLTRLAERFNHPISSFVISPDGEQVIFTSNTHEDALDGAYGQQLFLLKQQSIQPLTMYTAYASTPIWIDNQQIVYTQYKHAYAAAELIQHHVGIDQAKHLIPRMELRPTTIFYTDKHLWFTADYKGSHTLFRISNDSITYEEVTGRGYTLAEIQVSKDGQHWAWLRHNEVTPHELVYQPMLHVQQEPSTHTQSLQKIQQIKKKPDNQLAAVYAPNQNFIDTLNLVPYQTFTTESEDGYPLDVFFLPPTSQQNDSPVVLNIKGGPGGMWGHQWFPENQLLSGRGYAVTFVNYRGSTGYGHEHQQAVRFDYGGVDYRDNIAAIDAVIQRFPWLSVDKQYITGGSHGGFLTNWITTQTQRFKAAVTQRSVSNWVSEAGTQAYPPLSMTEEFQGTIWSNYDYYWGRSPLKYADQVKTPTLIIHSTSDHITPIGQGEEWFYALKANRVPVEMQIFYNEGHGLSRNGKPINLVERLKAIVDWFDQHP